METYEHKHQYKNGFCKCGAESANGRKRRLKREAKPKEERETVDLYTALRNKDGQT